MEMLRCLENILKLQKFVFGLATLLGLLPVSPNVSAARKLLCRKAGQGGH